MQIENKIEILEKNSTIIDNEQQVALSEKTAKVRDKILIGAMECFMEYSYSLVTMDIIANHLSMSKKTIYKHFKGKEELLIEVIKTQMCIYESELTPIFNKTNVDFIEWLIEIGTTISKQLTEIPIVFMKDIEKNAPFAWKTLMEHNERVIKSEFRKFIDTGVKAGDFRKDLPVEIIVDFYYFLINKVFIPNYVMNCGYTSAQLYNFVIKLFLEGLFTPFGREEYNAKSKQNNDINNLNFFLRTSE